MFNVSLIAIVFLAALGVSVALVVLVRGSRAAVTASKSQDPSTLFAVARWGAIIYAAIVGVFIVIGVVGTLVGDVTIDVPVKEFWPALDPRITIEATESASVVSGGFTTATLTIAGLDLTTRILLAVETVLGGGMSLAIALAVIFACRSVEGGRPFTSALPKVTTIAAIAVAIGGIGSQLVGGIAASMAANQALFVSAWSAENVGIDEEIVLGLPEPAVMINVDLWPIAIFVVLAALAALFSYGERMQRDTEGLV